MNKQSILFIIFLLFSKLLYVEVSLAKDPFIAGVNINGQWFNSYVDPDATAIAEWLPSINANWASVQVTLYQYELNSNEIWEATESKPSRCGTLSPTQPSIESYIKLLKDKGLNVFLKFHIRVCSPTGEELWSGHINPSSPSTWFKSYRIELDKYAKIAQKMNVDMFAFGNELAELSKGNETEWTTTIDAIKLEYDGALIYCAAFPNESYVDDAEYLHVDFWDQLEFIGINFWPHASQEQTPEVNQIKESYATFRDKLDNWYDGKELNQKIIITEYGVPDIDYCVTTPEAAGTCPVAVCLENQTCQENAYNAFFQAFCNGDSFDERIAGMFSHDDIVAHSSANPEETNIYDAYQIRGRKAEEVVKNWFLILTAEGVCFVDDSGSCGGKTPCYASIQSAIDNESTGTLIKVAEGTYPENVVVNKDVTLEFTWESDFSTIGEGPAVITGNHSPYCCR